jgi:hypothetical protein
VFVSTQLLYYRRLQAARIIFSYFLYYRCLKIEFFLDDQFRFRMEVYLRKSVPCGPYKGLEGGRPTKRRRRARGRSSKAVDPPASTDGCGWRLGRGGAGGGMEIARQYLVSVAGAVGLDMVAGWLLGG